MPAVSDRPTTSNKVSVSGVELFRIGSHRDSQGRARAWDSATLDEIASSYNSIVGTHDAPVVIGHEPRTMEADMGLPAGTFQPPEITPQGEAAYGWIERVYRDGDRLMGDFSDVNPSFAQAVNDKTYRKRSISLYPPTHPDNPTPGSWNVRHIAYVGIPAVKGMSDSQFHEFHDNADGLVTFDFSVSGTSDFSSNYGIARIFQGLRDWFIENKDLETAERLIPQFVIDSIKESDRYEQPMADGNYIMSRIDELTSIVMRLVQHEQDDEDEDEEYGMNYGEGWQKRLKGMDYAAIASRCDMSEDMVRKFADGSMKPSEDQMKRLTDAMSYLEKGAKTDMSENFEARMTALESQVSELQTANQSLTDANRALRAKLDYQEVSSFVEGLVRDRKVLPAKKTEKIQFLLSLPNADAFEYGEGETKRSLTPRAMAMADMAESKPLWGDADMPTRSSDAPPDLPASDFSGAPNVPLDKDSAELDRKVIAHCQKNSWDHTDIAYYERALVEVVAKLA